MSVRDILIAWVVVGALAAPVVAGAAPPEAAGLAQGLFEQAREDMKRGEYQAACPKLTESQRLDPSAGTLLNLVLCEESLGRTASAWVHSCELLDTLPAGDGRRALAERKVLALSKRVPKLVVRMPAAVPDGTSISLDDVDLGPSSLGVALPVDPGLHRLVVRAPGRNARTAEVSASEGQEAQWTVEVWAADAAAPDPSVPSPGSRRAQAASPAADRPHNTGRVPAWVALGIGAAGFVAGGVLGALALDRQATVLHDCPGKQCQNPSDLAAASQGQAFFIGSMAGLAVGAAGAGMGAYLLTHVAATPLVGLEPRVEGIRGVVASYRAAF